MTHTPVSNNTRSKKPTLHIGIQTVVKQRQKPYVVSASSLYNYMMKDTLVDWLKYTDKKSMKSRSHTNQFKHHLRRQGINFEDKLVKYIHNNIFPVVTVSTEITKRTLQRTKDLLHEGVPCIHSAPVYNSKNNTQGVIDLLVRSDYISKLVECDPLTETEKTTPAFLLQKPYHYIVIDIKFSTLPLRSDGVHLLNTDNYPAYKSQCLIYTQALGIIQGYTPPYAFILGRRWKYIKNSRTYNSVSCLSKLGKISYGGIDSEYYTHVTDGIQWLRDLHKNGHSWSVNPPSRRELYPNMCVHSGEWQQRKQEISDTISEMTDIWYINQKQRDLAISKGITSWKDKKCNTTNLGISGMRAPIIDSILSINRQTVDKIRPKRILNNLYNWKIASNEAYIDFETLNDVFSDFSELPLQNYTSMIFLIGITYMIDKTPHYKYFIANNLTNEAEFDMMTELHAFLESIGYPKLYYWYAEEGLWRKTLYKHYDNASEDKRILLDNMIYSWCDLCDIFRDEPIVIQGCFKFGLKEISKAMYKHGMIKTHITSDCVDGLTAMIRARKAYDETSTRDELVNNPVIRDIIQYNKFDCDTLCEIIAYLREHHL